MKTKTLFFLLFLSISQLNFAQENATTSFSRFQLGIHFSGDLAYRQLFNTSSDSLVISMVEWMKSKQSPIFGLNTGVNLCYRFSSRFGIESGLQFSKKGYRWGNDVWILDETKSAGGYLQKNATTTSINFYSISVPVRGNVHLGEKRLKFLLSAGFLVDYLVENRQVDKFNVDGKPFLKNVFKQTDEYERFNFTPTLSLGASYEWTPRMTLRIEPTFRYGLIYPDHNLVHTRLWSAGLNGGLYLGL